MKDESLQHPRCVVWNLLKSTYLATHLMWFQTLQVPLLICLNIVYKALGSTAADNRTTAILYATGWTQHSKGAEETSAVWQYDPVAAR